jgi:hypothetical protein
MAVSPASGGGFQASVIVCVLFQRCRDTVDASGWNGSRHLRARRIKEARNVEVRHGPLPAAEAVGVERDAAFPCGLQPDHRIGQPGRASLFTQRHRLRPQRVRAGKILGKEKATQPEAFFRRPSFVTDRQVVFADAKNLDAAIVSPRIQPGDQTVAVCDLSGLHGLDDHVEDLLTHRGLPFTAGPQHRRPLLLQPAGKLDPLPPRRITGIRPAVCEVQAVLECLPALPACPVGRIGIESP